MNKKIFWFADFLFIITAALGEADNSIISLSALLIIEIILVLLDIYSKHNEIA